VIDYQNQHFELLAHDIELAVDLVGGDEPIHDRPDTVVISCR